MHFKRSTNSSVLWVRTSASINHKLIHGLEERGFKVACAASLDHALAEINALQYPLVLLDLADCIAHPKKSVSQTSPIVSEKHNPEAPWLDVLREIRRISPVTQVVVIISKKADLTTCCRAVTNGAASFVEWHDGDPIDLIAYRLAQAFHRYHVVVQVGRALHSRDIFEETGLTGQSRVMAKLLFQAKRAATISDVPILINGESGTGKQLLAEAIHRMDPKRKDKAFLSVNCSAITGSLAESALFGHRKGAFTGATEDRLGYFRAADGGTLLLDEISELEKPLQPKLLRVLQEGLVLPVGDDVERKVDVRIIASSNRLLPILIEKGSFRIDLYQRLNVISLNIPPLRDRVEDIPPLVQFFLKRYASYYPYPIESVDENVYEVLSRSIGSGNVRELENAIRQILVFKKAGNRIELSDIPPGLLIKQTAHNTEGEIPLSLASAVETIIRSGRMTLSQMLEEFEGMILAEALARSNTNHTQLAKQLGLSRRTLYNKIHRFNLVQSHSK
ncbi:MAG: sigma-54-dependent Fis family transcriptional regulator [Planctomycetota bacterium]|nr:MAG: sigma-54-dependent Fis family transcriptional regulator [Planctomycetota bacterium]